MQKGGGLPVLVAGDLERLLLNQRPWTLGKNLLPLFGNRRGFVPLTNTQRTLRAVALVDGTLNPPIRLVGYEMKTWPKEEDGGGKNAAAMGEDYIEEKLLEALRHRMQLWRENRLNLSVVAAKTKRGEEEGEAREVSKKYAAFRLVNENGDDLTGLAIDVYGRYAEVQTYSVYWDKYLPFIRDKLMSPSLMPWLRGVIIRRRLKDNPNAPSRYFLNRAAILSELEAELVQLMREGSGTEEAPENIVRGLKQMNEEEEEDEVERYWRTQQRQQLQQYWELWKKRHEKQQLVKADEMERSEGEDVVQERDLASRILKVMEEEEKERRRRATVAAVAAQHKSRKKKPTKKQKKEKGKESDDELLDDMEEGNDEENEEEEEEDEAEKGKERGKAQLVEEEENNEERRRGSIVVKENDVKLLVDLRARSRSSGLFLDQRANRQFLVEQLLPSIDKSEEKEVNDLSVLNCFAHTCSWSVMAAAKLGANTTNIDTSEECLNTGKKNFVLNGIAVEEPISVNEDDDLDVLLEGKRRALWKMAVMKQQQKGMRSPLLSRHTFISGDVFTELPRLNRRGLKYSAVIVDPPALARTQTIKGGIFSAKNDYHQLVAMAAPLVQQGGFLLCFNNTRSKGQEAWQRDVLEKGGLQQLQTSRGKKKAGEETEWKIVCELGQDLDFRWKEGDFRVSKYLKGLVLQRVPKI
ncbi:hypothetical protein QOT17_021204 [Balamuthia mandrillaris]